MRYGFGLGVSRADAETKAKNNAKDTKVRKKMIYCGDSGLQTVSWKPV